MIPIRLNGHETQAMLDTGASLTTIDRAYARSIGLPEGFKIQAKGAGGDVDAELVSGLTLDIGALRIDKASVGVMDLATVARGIGRPINVVLGRDFFNSAVISIDWARKQLVVRPHESFQPDAAATAMQLTKRGPFNTISVSIAGAPPVEALFDLGNGSPLVMPITYWGHRPEVANLKYAGAMSGGVGGVHPARAVIVPSVTLAGKTFTLVPAILSESGNDDDPTQMTNVGIGLMKQFKVDLDLGRDRIYLTPRTDAPLFERDRAGVRFDLLDDRLKVTFVSPQGPAAAAGLKVGDEIVAVDERQVTHDYYSGPDWVRGPVGKSISLTRADGSKAKVTLSDYF
ncbi:aspartyl protease family protein [Sphingomonas sp.]|uniref:aspartyl protease family protein n=1 Tax=Sphingomonas sp. TaxID=28214 RepID=UPI0038A2F964